MSNRKALHPNSHYSFYEQPIMYLRATDHVFTSNRLCTYKQPIMYLIHWNCKWKHENFACKFLTNCSDKNSFKLESLTTKNEKVLLMFLVFIWMQTPNYWHALYEPRNVKVTIVSVPRRLPERLICGTDL